MDDSRQAHRLLYPAVFLTAAATVMLEVLLTRIFSVTMYYHFAFFCVSVAMFGMTLGAVLVYLLPQFFLPDRTVEHMRLSSLFFSAFIVIALLTHLSLPFVMIPSLVSLYTLLLTYLVLALPFTMSGVCICLALTRYPRCLNRIYASDLCGAAAACLLVVLVLKAVDGPTAVLAAAFIASLASCLFAAAAGKAGKGAAFAVFMGLFAAASGASARSQAPLLKLQWVKGLPEQNVIFEKWNSFSRIAVRPSGSTPMGAGLSRILPASFAREQLLLDIDADASTVITSFDGRLEPLEYLRYDVANLVHYLRPGSKTLVVGSGGGRDVLSALFFRQKEIEAVEINEDILATANGRFGSFSGHLDRLPNVRFVNDEARSHIERSTEAFDILAISFIDTWAATAAGALALTENSLYTTEAWKTFMGRLTPRGILSVSRWYNGANPMETHRTLSLARAALLEAGIRNPENHIISATNYSGESLEQNRQATVLVSREPFSADDVSELQRRCEELKFTILAAPGYAADPVIGAIVSGRGLKEVSASLPYNIEAPTDDNPFFFNMLRLTDLLRRQSVPSRFLNSNVKAIGVLYLLLLLTAVLTYYAVVYPLRRRLPAMTKESRRCFAVYFIAIGLAYMLVEISQLQRLSVFLGHPVYSLTLVLSTLLLSSGIGSAASPKLAALVKRGSRILIVLLAALLLFALLSGPVIAHFRGETTAVRLFIAAGLLFPIGLLMGMAFPSGMSELNRTCEEAGPWFWGINGAASVVASVLAAVISLGAGIMAAFATGIACYAAAWAALRTIEKKASAGSSTTGSR